MLFLHGAHRPMEVLIVLEVPLMVRTQNSDRSYLAPSTNAEVRTLL